MRRPEAALLPEETGLTLYAINALRIRLIKLDRISLSASILPTAFDDHLAVIATVRSRDVHHAWTRWTGTSMNARERALEL